jgi:hypothetical protein
MLQLHPLEIWLVTFRIYYICKIKHNLSKHMINTDIYVWDRICFYCYKILIFLRLSFSDSCNKIPLRLSIKGETDIAYFPVFDFWGIFSRHPSISGNNYYWTRHMMERNIRPAHWRPRGHYKIVHLYPFNFF